ncbi:MAG: hypothetical protein VKO39_13685 [Cyanobacteriota bacterium]|nr:hypothetical protein [Cyanobacteriota bacterium]
MPTAELPADGLQLPRYGVVRRLNPHTGEMYASGVLPLRRAAEIAAAEAVSQPDYVWDVWAVPPWPVPTIDPQARGRAQ